jgi:RNA polymerase sigma-70 factor (ECF subfamily)
VETVLSSRLLPRVDATAEPGWLAAARLGEPWALEQFYHAYQPPVYALCRRLLGRSDDAQDAMQATFVRAFRALPRFRGDSVPKTWVYRIAVNESVGMLRRRRDAPEFEEDALGGRDGTASVVERLAVQATLSRMKESHRTILVLRFWESLSYDEIADVLGISMPAVKMRLNRARDEFRQSYGGSL